MGQVYCEAWGGGKDETGEVWKLPGYLDLITNTANILGNVLIRNRRLSQERYLEYIDTSLHLTMYINYTKLYTKFGVHLNNLMPYLIRYFGTQY